MKKLNRGVAVVGTGMSRFGAFPDKSTRDLFVEAYQDMSAAVDKGRTFAAEVLNLTRNVTLEGTPGGRAHVFVRATGKQSLAGVAIRHIGPRQPAEESDAPVVGRYPLHFHMAGDGSRGSVRAAPSLHSRGCPPASTGGGRRRLPGSTSPSVAPSPGRSLRKS